jgi:mRNA interferase MazF
VLVVQDDLLTESRLSTVMVVPLTSNLRRAVAAGNVTLEVKETGLDGASVALVCQVLTLDKAALTEQVGAVRRAAMRKVDAGLRLALGLGV